MFNPVKLPDVASLWYDVAMTNESCMPQRKLTAHEVRAVAVRAVCSIPTVKKWLAGGELRSTCLERIEKAARVLGYLDKVG